MAQKVEERRAALRDRLLLIAERRIAEDGLGALRARDLAADAGCALGAIYNVFGDLGDLILAVNARTFRTMGADVAEALAAAPADPTEQLVVMGRAYHAFAAANPGLWRALFDYDRPAGEAAPEWYLEEMGRLFAYIEAPIRVLIPEMTKADRALFARVLFSSVHGIVLLGLDDASGGVPRDQLDRMIGLTLGRMVD